MKTGRNNDRRNFRIDESPHHCRNMSINLNLVKVAMNFLNRPAIPEAGIEPAELFIGDPAGNPFLEVSARGVFPDPEPLMDVPPRAGDSGQGSIEVKNY